MRSDKAKKYLELAEHMADLFSKDPSKKVGAIVLAPDSLQILSMGYNGMPRGVAEDRAERWEKPRKYMYVEHAERNCLYNACRHGTPLEGSIAVVTLYPCSDCARALIQAGIQTLVSYEPDLEDDRWGEHFKVSKEMFEETGIQQILFPLRKHLNE